jgi:molecular chaperone DnaK (HSP70)
MISKFEQKKGLNLKESKRACLKLLEAIQRQRKILSGISETEISIECLMEDEDFSESFTREIMINAASEIFGEINNHFSSFK